MKKNMLSLIRKSKFIIYVLLLTLGACSPKITTTLNKNYSTLDYKENVTVFGVEDSVPCLFEEIGIVKIGDTGFTTKCSYDAVIEAAKLEARKAGGNAIKIVEHIPPSIWGSSCHRIKAKILKVSDFDSVSQTPVTDTILSHADYALIHLYRFSGVGAFVNYDIHLGDSVICRAKNNWRKTLHIKKDGLNTIWAKTEAKEELPINIKIGKEYYIRCGVTMGAFVGHPKLDLVSTDIGKAEYLSVKANKDELMDKLILKDGKTINCLINDEDSENVYITIVKKHKEIKTQILKENIKEILRYE